MRIRVTKDESTASVRDRWNLYARGKFVGTWRGTKREAILKAFEYALTVAVSA